MNNFKDQLKKIEQLPTLPQVVTKIMQLVENPRTSAMEITRVISLDPALTVKILKIVNSAYYGFPKQIRTISHAIMILGFEDVKNIALSVSVFDILQKNNNDDPLFDRTAFWQHSIAVGVCSKLLAKKLRFKNPEEVFIAGLLHDIGKIIQDQYLPEHFQRIINTIHEKKMLYINAERSLGEKDHTEIGGIVAKKWKLPTAIYNVIFYHHQPDKMKKLDTLVCLVHAADIFVRIQKIGSGGDPLVPQLLKPAWHHLGLVPDDISKIYAALHEEVSKADAFLEFTKTNQE